MIALHSLLALYSLGLAIALLLGAPYWLPRMFSSGKYREGLSERLGAAPPRLSPGAGRRSIWVHAVSVGEVLAAGRLIAELKSRAPHYPLRLSTVTRTGQSLARERVGADSAFYFPLDFGWIVRRYLKRLRPAMLVLVETELWPNVLAACASASIPVVLVNARISDRSFPRYRRMRFLWKRLLPGLSLALAQSEEDVRRLKEIGVPEGRAVLGGNLKFDLAPAEMKPLVALLRKNLNAGTRVLVCGSTLEGEEELLLEAFRGLLKQAPDLVMIVAPRHPERFPKVAALLAESSVPVLRRSQWAEAPAKIEGGTALLLDSIGELACIYSLATVAFVGGSLVPAGGHNPLEPARFGVPIVMGPHFANFRSIVETLLGRDALKIANREALGHVLLSLLEDSDGASLVGARAMEVFDSQAGATERAVQAVLALLPGDDPGMGTAAQAGAASETGQSATREPTR